MTDFDTTNTLDLFFDDIDDIDDIDDMFTNDDAAEAWEWANDVELEVA